MVVLKHSIGMLPVTLCFTRLSRGMMLAAGRLWRDDIISG